MDIIFVLVFIATTALLLMHFTSNSEEELEVLKEPKDSLLKTRIQKATRISERRVYKHNVIKRIMNKYDPMGMFSSGCPDDEYESEVQILVVLSRYFNSEVSTNEIVTKLFNDRFLTDLKPHQFSEMSRELFKVLNEK